MAASSPQRRYPRAAVHVPVRLTLAKDPRRAFEATLPSANISVGGLFLESTFFLKLGTELNVHLTLPLAGTKSGTVAVTARGTVVRVESATPRGQPQGRTGFAIKFTDYDEGSRVALATFFLGPVVRSFIDDYVRERKLRPTRELVAQLVDVLAAWELRRNELPEAPSLSNSVRPRR